MSKHVSIRGVEIENNCCGTTSVVCSNCGHVHSDSSKMVTEEGPQAVVCAECGAGFVVEKQTLVTYVSKCINHAYVHRGYFKRADDREFKTLTCRKCGQTAVEEITGAGELVEWENAEDMPDLKMVLR